MSTFAADLGRLARGLPRRAVAVPRALRPRRLIIAAILIVALAATYHFWFRNSSLVAVEEVKVSGLSYSEVEVSAALAQAGEGMTTLNVDMGELERAVDGFPTVAGLAVESDFPHKLVITVTEREPVATVGADGGIAVAGDGTLLSGIATGNLELPAIEIENAPTSGRLDGAALEQAEVFGAAPKPLRPAIRGSRMHGEFGIVVELVEGIELRFGDPEEAAAKWAAAAAILADPKLDQLSYIDLRVPGRPAVGGAPLPESTADDAAAAAAEAGAPVAAETAPAAPEGTPVAPDPTAPATATPPAQGPVAPAPAAPGAAPATGVAGGAPAP